MINYKLHLIRHAETEGNRNGCYVGRTDMPLSPEGFAQAMEMKQKYEYPQIDRLYISPMLRCRQTAKILYPDLTPQPVEGLIEYSFGDFEGKSFTALQNDPAYLAWLADSVHNAPPHGESGVDFFNRIVGGLEQIFREMMAQKITSAGVVTHGGVIMTLMRACCKPQQDMFRYTTQNCCGFTVLMTPQMWMRDNSFELYDLIPSVLEKEEDRWVTGYGAFNIQR